MQLIIHAGMNKTGSSSIQHVLAGMVDANFEYVRWNSPNHSEMFVLLFQADAILERYHIFQTQGVGLAELRRRRVTWLSQLDEQISAARKGKMIFSGEDITQPSRSETGVSRMRDYFSKSFQDIRVIAYVRSPQSFINSSFQQKVKSAGLDHIDMSGLWPSYRQRFERLDNVFGRENVTLVKFDKDALHQGDVVEDFIHRTGLSGTREPARRVNDSLSLEALALLFAHRRLTGGMKKGFASATKQNNALVHQLSRVKGRKFELSARLIRSAIDDNAADLEWIETRLGQSLSEDVVARDGQVESEDDLLRIAQSNIAGLSEVVGQLARRRGIPEEKRLAALLACAESLTSR